MLKAKINRLKKKGFRDAFVRSHLTHGLAHQIRTLRAQRGWTQSELAEKLGLKTQSAVARMEDPSYGRLSVATLLKLSSIFDVALSVRFVSFSKFLLEREDVSPAALSAESFDVEAPKLLEAMERADHYVTKKIASPATSDFYHATISIPATVKYKNFADVSHGVNP